MQEHRKFVMNTEINDLLLKLLQQVQSILMDEFIGMYVGGSIANNSFNLETSDIDCYILTSNNLSKNIIHEIEEMHKQFYSSQLPYAEKIEASYILKNDLLNFDPKHIRPYFNEGDFYLAPYGSNFIIELFILKEKGITIAGPDIKDLIKEISVKYLQQATKNNLQEYWELVLQDLSKFKRSDYQVFAILTMCRTLYTLEKGSIASKSEAAQWAINKLDVNWKILIKKALFWKLNSDLNKQEETREFVKYVTNLSRKSKKNFRDNIDNSNENNNL